VFFVFQPIYGFCLVRCSACALHLLLCFRSTHIVWFDPSIVTFVPTVCITLFLDVPSSVFLDVASSGLFSLQFLLALEFSIFLWRCRIFLFLIWTCPWPLMALSSMYVFCQCVFFRLAAFSSPLDFLEIFFCFPSCFFMAFYYTEFFRIF
jgi:hypothetical protein